MIRGEKGSNIHCPSGLFARQEAEVNRVTQAINQARRATEKAGWAQVLIEVVAVLLECDEYDEESQHCRLCQEFSELRRKTAALVVKAAQLQEHRQSQKRSAPSWRSNS